ncbi:alpha/beta fold hydrolase [Rouxiella sp. WC2420]|uniref:Alpha/beta fold hydrolase n=1 Tax=Rouxiella sp. WC2420 TaxID=3234145 RepID=A0AB39VWK8_9GAMM
MSTQIIDGMVIETQGKGEALLCIHGLGGSSNIWTPLLPAFASFNLLRIDLPGSARSALPADLLSIESYVASVERVLDALDIDSVHIVAHSMGTIIAQHFAVKNPSRVKTLALFGPLLAPPDAGRPGIHGRAKLCREQGVKGLQEIADAIIKGATSEETKDSKPAVVALIRESVMRQTPEGYAQSCEALANAQPAQIEKIAVPVLLVTGQEDGVGSPEQVQTMANRLDKPSVKILEGCGHWTTFEKPDECLIQLINFYNN